jgi:transcriptional antiterminator NusG
MEMTDEAYHLVKNTPKVTGFLGTQNKPQPVSDREVERILGRVAEVGAAKPRNLIHYETGERVRVSDGPFQSFEGMVSEVDEERGRLKVAVMIFGRETPVDLEYNQVEKLR